MTPFFVRCHSGSLPRRYLVARHPKRATKLAMWAHGVNVPPQPASPSPARLVRPPRSHRAALAGLLRRR
jgi:hypothetical protein